MSKTYTPGLIESTDPTRVLLYNFNVNEYQLKQQHEAYLRAFVVPKLSRGGSISIVGLASRTGTVRHNDLISEQRAHRVLGFLKHNVPQGFPVREFKAFGERKARHDGVRDGVEDERYRSVLCLVSDGPKPPEPKLDPDSMLRELPAFQTEGGWMEGAGWGLDGASMAQSIVSLFVESFLADALGAGIAAIGGLVGLAEAQRSGQALAESRGKKDGFSNAMQKMADAFSNSDLKNVPESSWPSIPRPVFASRAPNQMLTLAEQKANDGRRVGYEQAWKMISEMERTPRDFDVTSGGQRKKVKMSGRRFLWMLRRRYGDEVKEVLLKQLEVKAQ